MPELPEVEVVRRHLADSLVGDRLCGVKIRRADLREPIPRRRLVQASGNATVTSARRRSKYLLLDLDNEQTIVVHLGMSGRLRYFGPGDPAEPHEHVIWQLATGRELRFRDPRRFGLVLVMRTARLHADRHFEHLGPEPLDLELGPLIDGDTLRAQVGRRRTEVKNYLMDAKVVVGVGNIYASEALWRAGIHPRRSVARISQARWNLLAQQVAAVLRAAVEQGGTTLNDFSSAAGEPGYFAVDLAVYGKDGRECARCGSEIRRIVQAGRSSFYCPGCQR